MSLSVKPKHASIDLNLIDESRIEKVMKRNGKEARFLNIVMFETPNSEYGTHLIKQERSIFEAEREINLPIIGNVRKGSKKKYITPIPLTPLTPLTPLIPQEAIKT